MNDTVKPFIKWVGGKRQLLNTFNEIYPKELSMIDTYIEPFVGGGAVLFDILNKYNIPNVYIFDLNLALINTYNAIKLDVDKLIIKLYDLENEYHNKTEDEQKIFYYEKRDEFNTIIEDLNSNDVCINSAALFILLNRTCFNGLYRVNKKGKFNVPRNNSKKPMILDKKTLQSVNKKLQHVNIIYGDYKESLKYISKNTFIYCDPPYRPISVQNFKSYDESGFNDEDQIELSNFFKNVDKKGAKIMLSNSDPKNSNPNDNFFDNLYSDFNILRVHASRIVNSKASGRSKISEILVKNF